jgi:hypothetical protein
MSYTYARLKGLVRSLVDDPRGTVVTDDFLLPIANQVYDEANSQLQTTQSSWDIAVVECPGITPGTPNLASLQQWEQPLGTLTDQPLRIDWKPAGNPPQDYRLVPNYEVLPDFNPDQYIPGWEYRSEIIWLGPASIAVDLRIRGEFGPPPLTADDSVLISHPRIGYPVAYGCAALIGAIRGNAAWEKSYNEKAIEGMDEIMGELVRTSAQPSIRRLGSQTNGRRTGYR